jgi:hypothetical protein
MALLAFGMESWRLEKGEIPACFWIAEGFTFARGKMKMKVWGKEASTPVSTSL